MDTGRADNETERQDSRKQETKKERVIASPDAIVHPLTMVIAVIDTVIAQSTVAGPGWTVCLACHTVLDAHSVRSDPKVSGKRDFITSIRRGSNGKRRVWI